MKSIVILKQKPSFVNFVIRLVVLCSFFFIYLGSEDGILLPLSVGIFSSFFLFKEYFFLLDKSLVCLEGDNLNIAHFVFFSQFKINIKNSIVKMEHNNDHFLISIESDSCIKIYGKIDNLLSDESCIDQLRFGLYSKKNQLDILVLKKKYIGLIVWVFIIFVSLISVVASLGNNSNIIMFILLLCVSFYNAIRAYKIQIAQPFFEIDERNIYVRKSYYPGGSDPIALSRNNSQIVFNEKTGALRISCGLAIYFVNEKVNLEKTSDGAIQKLKLLSLNEST